MSWSKRKWAKVIGITASALALVLVILVLLANRMVTPMLRNQLHTLIVQGSDSLYNYKLGSLDANFFGGSVAVENLHIRIDSNHYRRLHAAHALPALTMQLDLQRGYINGLSVFKLLFSKTIDINEVGSGEANVTLSRHVQPEDSLVNRQALWKALQPAIKKIKIDHINLDGIRLLYHHADTSESVKLEFDRCVARFNDVRVDSASEADTTRIAFTKDITLQFSDLRYRTPDSLYNMAADSLYYSSGKQYLEIINFALQPTLDREAFYKTVGGGNDIFHAHFKRAYFTRLRLDKFIHNNIILADSAVVLQPELSIYMDKTLPAPYKNKFGAYPHQHLLHAGMAVDVPHMRFADATIAYTERGELSGKEGTLRFTQTNMVVSNVTNLPARIRQNPVCVANVQTQIFESSPLQAKFTFYLDSAEGQWAVDGNVRNISAAQLNQVAIPLGNSELTSGNIEHIEFALQGDNYHGNGKVDMRYQNMAVILRKKDEETGALEIKKLVTKLVNRFSLYSDNPGPDGVLRRGNNVIYARPSNKSYFAVIWKTLFKGMQDVMLKSGVYE